MKSAINPPLILASASPRRLKLLLQIGIVPNDVIHADIKEEPLSGENPRQFAIRMAVGKVRKVAENHRGACVIGADTVVALGRRILPKAEDRSTAEECLQQLSGRAHRVFGGLAVLGMNGRISERLVLTRVKFKKLSSEEQSAYLASEEWRGKAGGYAIQGRAAAFVSSINGSYSNVVGLPLFETAALLPRFLSIRSE